MKKAKILCVLISAILVLTLFCACKTNKDITVCKASKVDVENAYTTVNVRNPKQLPSVVYNGTDYENIPKCGLIFDEEQLKTAFLQASGEDSAKYFRGLNFSKNFVLVVCYQFAGGGNKVYYDYNFTPGQTLKNRPTIRYKQVDTDAQPGMTQFADFVILPLEGQYDSKDIDMFMRIQIIPDTNIRTFIEDAEQNLYRTVVVRSPKGGQSPHLAPVTLQSGGNRRAFLVVRDYAILKEIFELTSTYATEDYIPANIMDTHCVLVIYEIQSSFGCRQYGGLSINGNQLALQITHRSAGTDAFGSSIDFVFIPLTQLPSDAEISTQAGYALTLPGDAY